MFDVHDFNIFNIWSALVGALLLVLSYRTLRFRNGIVKLRDVEGHQEFAAWRKISIVIPACNEEQTIGPAISALLKVNYANLEIVIVNDRSTDETGRIIDGLAATDTRVKAVHITSLPDGWLGKVHALHRGVELTSGRWLLFMDADVHFAPDALKKAVIHAYKHQLDFLAVIPDISTPGLPLQMAMAQLFHQASLVLNPRRLNEPAHKICYGQGAFMMLRRNVYERSERLDWLKMEAVDDTGLAVLMRRAGAKMGVLSGLDEIKLEWYRDLPAFVRGLEKNSFAVCGYRIAVPALLILAGLAIVFGYTIAPFLATSPAVRVFSACALGIYLFAAKAQLESILRIPLLAIALFPLSSVLLPLICMRSAVLLLWRGGISWRGTSYSIAQLRAGQRVKYSNLKFADHQFQNPAPLPSSSQAGELERPKAA